VLKEKFPRLFTITQYLDSQVGDLVHREHITREGCSTWKLGWRRERFVWKKKEEETMLAMISKARWRVEGQDRLVWVGDGQQEYTVKSGYSVLNMEDQMQASEALKILCGLKIAPSATVCSWRLMVDRLPTRSNLSLRGLQLTSLSCPLCLESVESGQHLFVTCKVAQNVWNQCERWVGIVNVRHETIEAHFLSFCLLFRRQTVNVAWKGMWVAIVTEIWNQRNKVVFNRG